MLFCTKIVLFVLFRTKNVLFVPNGHVRISNKLSVLPSFASFSLSTYILTPQKDLGEKVNVKFFTVARYFEVIFFIGLIESVKNETFCLF